MARPPARGPADIRQPYSSANIAESHPNLRLRRRKVTTLRMLSCYISMVLLLLRDDGSNMIAESRMTE